jgi:hypothetical protein
MRTRTILSLLPLLSLLAACGPELADDPAFTSRAALDADGGPDLDAGAPDSSADVSALDAGCAPVAVAEPVPADTVPDDTELAGSGCGATGSGVALAPVLLAALLLLRRGRRQAALLAVALVGGVAGTARAAAPAAAGFAVDRFDPAAAGSAWFAADDLNLEGRLRPSLGVTADFADAPLVLRSPTTGTHALIARQLVSHLSASFVALDRVRFGASLPLVLGSQTESAVFMGRAYAPAGGLAPGDMRVDADVRLFGSSSGPLTVAVGARLYVATGSVDAFASDGHARAAVRLAAAGALGSWRYALEGLAVARPSQPGSAEVPAGSGATLTGAFGWQSRGGQVRIGPEAFVTFDHDASTVIRSSASASAEALLGAHVQLGAMTVGLGAGPGLT